MRTQNKMHRSADPKLVKSDLEKLVDGLEKRMAIANKSNSTIKNYVRGIKMLYQFHGLHPKTLEIDQVIDFLAFLQFEKHRNWRTIKLYVAGLRFYYQEIANNVELALQIPYPKEKPSLPEILSREELKQLFDSCQNFKHKVMFRLMYSAGLRRAELVNLKITDIDSKDGKRRIRIKNGKGNKDRYTILSETILLQLRDYFIMCRPKIYLFNGRIKGTPMSFAGLQHALKSAIYKSGITKPVNMHILRHCFASHALEDGLNIKTLQVLLGHSSIKTTLIYLHVSEIPLSKAFSPLDNW